MKDTAVTVSAQRRLDPARLVKALRGDPDWIVMKALEKARDRRYQSPASFADDVERYLRGEAILARPPSTVYRLRKFAQRHRGAAAAVAAVAAALVVGAALLPLAIMNNLGRGHFDRRRRPATRERKP